MPNIIWKRPDGSLAHTVLVEATDPAAHAEELKAAGLIPADWQVAGTDVQELPLHVAIEAWEWVDGAVAVGVSRARAWHKGRLRAARAPVLAALDVAVLRAQETGASTADLVAEKQRLRDLPAKLDALTTWAEMAAVAP